MSPGAIGIKSDQLRNITAVVAHTVSDAESLGALGGKPHLGLGFRNPGCCRSKARLYSLSHGLTHSHSFTVVVPGRVRVALVLVAAVIFNPVLTRSSSAKLEAFRPKHCKPESSTCLQPGTWMTNFWADMRLREAETPASPPGPKL